MDLIKVMKVLADETRMRILNILKDEELCVCEIEIILDISQSNASRHLNRLMNAKVLDNYKDGNYVYYKINEKGVEEYPFIREIIEKHTMKDEIYKKDYGRLKEFRKRGLTCNSIEEGEIF
ncbi:MAG: winged helix-turn-helix transcriptional regulator [Tissierellia bacterium]|nr:winged helix-turn-helix transcriptional regulator [Tissierellia bacterium]